MRLVRRLRAHPDVAAALRDDRVSVSRARQICDWTDLLPGDARCDTDAISLAAAAGGAGLADLAGLAERRSTSAAALTYPSNGPTMGLNTGGEPQ